MSKDFLKKVSRLKSQIASTNSEFKIKGLYERLGHLVSNNWDQFQTVVVTPKVEVKPVRTEIVEPPPLSRGDIWLVNFLRLKEQKNVLIIHYTNNLVLINDRFLSMEDPMAIETAVRYPTSDLRFIQRTSP